jgi:hypothetical protein
LPEDRVCHFAHLRNRSTVGSAFLTTQFILPTAAAWNCQQMTLFFTNGRMRPLLHEGFQFSCPVFEIFAASRARGIAGRSRLSLCTPQKSVDHWECVFDHPAHPTGGCILGLPRNDTFFLGMTKCDPSSMKDFIYFSGL